MNKKSEFVRNQLQYLLLQLEVNQLNSLLEFSSEILLFFAKYSFLFENSSDSINSCTADTSQFLMPQAFRERPVMYTDPLGLNTLDDYNYQKFCESNEAKREKGEEISVQEQRDYTHRERELAIKNQGLTDYGKAIHNNEEFFYDFMDKKFDGNNPLNQLDLDKILGYNTTLGTTQSCLLASLYNGYGSQLRNGITGQQIIDTLYDGGNFRKAPDGNPYITFEYDKRSESKAPYIRGDQLGNFSWSISSTLGLSQYIHIGPTERYDSIANDYISMKNGLYGILKMENKKKPGNFHFVYVHDYRIIDSLPENRNKPEYKERTLMLLW